MNKYQTETEDGMLVAYIAIFTLPALIVYMSISMMNFNRKLINMPEKDACIEFYSNSTNLPARCFKYFVK